MKIQDIITESTETLLEYKSGVMRTIQQLLPTWPEYVIKDWLYTGIIREYRVNGKMPDIEENVRWQIGYAGLTPQTQWRLVTFRFDLDDEWDKKTKQQLKQRIAGQTMSYIERDAERHATQSNLLATRGISREPVIIIITSDGYELVEGWHRTVQHFKANPNGYMGPAWIARQT